MMNRAALPSILALLALLVVVSCARAGSVESLRSGAFAPPRVAPDFSLNGSNGTALQLSRYRGKVVALGFGYTSCPEVCPTTMAFLAQARRQLGSARDDFQVLYVTVDPERDTTDRLRKFVTAFDPTFIGGTGSPGQLAAVRSAYGIQVSRIGSTTSGGDYLLHHSSSVYLIDRSGRLRAMMPYGVSVDDIAHDVKVLLAKPASE